jgi:undecaprenyl diphosphate synthase
MDGNRRFAEKNNMSKKEGYNVGLEQFINFIKYQIKYNIKETSYFALSSDNLKKRSNYELNILKKLLETLSSDKEIKTLFVNNKIKLQIKGDVGNSKKKIKELGIEEFENKISKLNNENQTHAYTVNIALNYDGQIEISEAFKKVHKKIISGELSENQITPEIIKQNIWFNGNIPEIIVRPGNAPRLSGFMLWDSGYSELYLTKKLWPELSEEDYKEIIDWYSKQKRNFGK